MGYFTNFYGTVGMTQETFKSIEDDLRKVFQTTYSENGKRVVKDGFHYDEEKQELDIDSFSKHYGDNFEDLINTLIELSHSDGDRLLDVDEDQEHIEEYL